MPCQPCSTKKRTAHSGLNALSTSGLWLILSNPIAASDANHNRVIGPNTLPTFMVPKR